MRKLQKDDAEVGAACQSDNNDKDYSRGFKVIDPEPIVPESLKEQIDRSPPPPVFTKEQRMLVVEMWHHVENQVEKVPIAYTIPRYNY